MYEDPTSRNGGIGRRSGFKIRRLKSVWVQVPLPALSWVLLAQEPQSKLLTGKVAMRPQTEQAFDRIDQHLQSAQALLEGIRQEFRTFRRVALLSGIIVVLGSLLPVLPIIFR